MALPPLNAFPPTTRAAHAREHRAATVARECRRRDAAAGGGGASQGPELVRDARHHTLDLNPVIVTEIGAVVVDARAWREKRRPEGARAP